MAWLHYTPSIGVVDKTHELPFKTKFTRDARLNVTGDFDGDGYDEIALAANRQGTEGNDFYVVKYRRIRSNGLYSWIDMNTISSHPFGASIDFSSVNFSAKQALAGDFDGDGKDELAVIPKTWGTEGNDIWVMKYDVASKSWNHLSSIASHSMEADIDLSVSPITILFGAVGDFDGDGADELLFVPRLSGTVGNDIWVMKFNVVGHYWYKLGPIADHPFGASIDCSSLNYAVRSCIVGDYNGDGKDEIAFIPFAPGSAGNDLWVMGYDPNVTSWYHISPISGHPMLADLDSYGGDIGIYFGSSGDFDGDGIDEIVLAPRLPGTEGNDFWVLKLNPAGNFWVHLSPIPRHPFEASIDCGEMAYRAKFALVVDFDGDGIDEIAVVPDAKGSEGNDIWIMKYDPVLGFQHRSLAINHPMQTDLDLSADIDVVTLAFAGRFIFSEQEDLLFCTDKPLVLNVTG